MYSLLKLLPCGEFTVQRSETMGLFRAVNKVGSANQAMWGAWLGQGLRKRSLPRFQGSGAGRPDIRLLSKARSLLPGRIFCKRQKRTLQRSTDHFSSALLCCVCVCMRVRVVGMTVISIRLFSSCSLQSFGGN